MKIVTKDPTKTRDRANLFSGADNIQNNQIAVNPIGKAINCFKFSIQGPGFGKNEINLGLKLRTRQGRQKPNAKDKKIG